MATIGLGGGNRRGRPTIRSAKRVEPDVLTGFLDQGKQIGSLIFDATAADNAGNADDAAGTGDAAEADEPAIPISVPPPLPPTTA